MPPLSLDDVSDDEIAELAASSGLDLSNPVRREFLKEMKSRDVQAAPGAGKTTLLGLKLRLLGRRWTPDMGAIAIVTHTNVARQEIENQLLGRPDAQRLLRYPHFIGTLTAFAHQFLALPTVRGLGFQVQSIDTEIFTSAAAAALRASPNASGWVSNQSGLPASASFLDRLKAGALKIAGSLTLDVENPRQLALVPGLANRSSPTFVALQEVKDSLNARGLFSYEDMMAIANNTLNGIPELRQALATRFALIVLDEAQDTSEAAFNMLYSIRDAGAVLQCIGDVNQAILADGASPAWKPATDALDLNETKRFGPSLARVASKLSIHRPQDIASTKQPDSLLYAILFAEDTEQAVASEYAKLLASDLGGEGNFWAVGHRRNSSESAKKKQLVLGSYFPTLKSQDPQVETLLLHASVVQFGIGARELEQVENALRETISFCCKLGADGETLRQGRLLKTCDRHFPEIGRGLRDWISDQLEKPPTTEALWAEAKASLLAGLATFAPDLSLFETCGNLQFAGDPQTIEQTTTDGAYEIFDISGTKVRINVGTIASIKGQTHDATLLLQTSYFNIRPFGKFAEALNAKTTKKWGPKEASLLANFYVATTRPRKLLAVAAQADQIGEKDRNLLKLSGWTILEIAK